MLVFNQQMITERVEVIGVEARFVRAIETLSHLNVEYLEAEAACCFSICKGIREAKAVAADLRVDARLGSRSR